MLSNELIKTETYAIPLGEKTLFYAPLTRSFVVYEGMLSMEDVDKEWLRDATTPSNIPDFIRDKGFVLDKEKIRLRLNVTTGCNLGCDYCSVRAGGSNAKEMPEEVAMNAIDGFCAFASQNDAKTLEVTYSGGEPTLRIPFIKKVIERAREKIGEGIKLTHRLLTNGLFKREEYTRILGDIRETQVSWDGFLDESPRYGANTQLARKVWDNIGFLLENKVPVSVLTVVSEKNSTRLRTIVDELYAYGIRHLFLNLKETLGRALGGRAAIDYAALGKTYLELWKDYRAKGMDINLTGTDIHSVSPFPCSVPVPNYSVAPDGTISACTISFNDKTGLAKQFEIGKVNDQGVIFDEAAIKTVRRFHVLNLDGCSTCFAKWHCRGGCVYAKNGDWFSTLPPERCAMIRDVVASKLLAAIEEQCPF